jgi:hypothetical protein
MIAFITTAGMRNFNQRNLLNIEIDFEGKRYPVEIPQGDSTEQLLTLTAGENAVYQGDEIGSVSAARIHGK